MIKLPVIERATRALMQRLETIQKVNGYDFDVKHVYRKRDIPERAEDPIEIHLLFGETDIVQGNNTHQAKERRRCFIWFVMKETGKNDEDLQYNLFIASLQKCLGEVAANDNSLVVDTSNPNRHFEVGIYQEQHLPRYAETRKGFIVGRLEIYIEYVYMHDNQYKWDHLDTEITEG